MKLKNLLLPLLGAILLIADFGFDAINPVLTAFGMTEKWLNVVKALFGLYGLYRIAKNKSVVTDKN